MENTVTYLACFYPEEDGTISVMFPDVPTGLTEGENREDALDAAAEALGETLAWMASEKEDFPAASQDVQAVFEAYAKEHYGKLPEGSFIESISINPADFHYED